MPSSVWVRTLNPGGRKINRIGVESLNSVPNRRGEVVVATRYGLVYAYWSDGGPSGKPHIFLYLVHKGRLFRGKRAMTSYRQQEASIQHTDYIREWAETVVKRCEEKEGVQLPPSDAALTVENMALKDALRGMIGLARSWMRETEARGIASWPTKDSLPVELARAIELLGEDGG